MKYHERSRAILAADLPAPQKFVLLALSDHADPHGRCWPSVGTLAAETSQSRRTVGRAVQALVASGWLALDSKPGNRRAYLLTLEEGASVTESRSRVTESRPPSVTESQGRVRESQASVRESRPTERAKNDPLTGQSSVPAPLAADPIQPGSVRFAALVARYSAPDIPTARRWKSKPAADLDWFAGTLLPLCPPDFDVLATFEEIDLWIEGQLRQGGGKAWKPGGWKGGIRRWMLRDIAKHKTQPPAAYGQRQATEQPEGPTKPCPRWIDDCDRADCIDLLAGPELDGDRYWVEHRLAELTAAKPPRLHIVGEPA